MSKFPMMVCGIQIGECLGETPNRELRNFHGCVLSQWVCDMLGTTHDIKWLVAVDLVNDCEVEIQDGEASPIVKVPAERLLNAIIVRRMAKIA